MNLPNKLTMMRVLLIPLCILFIVLGYYTLAALVFSLASLTDLLDGYLARKYQQVTTFGKFADPAADKILVLTTMIALLYQGLYPWWAVCIVAARELAVDGLRMVAVGEKLVIPAGSLGKYKTNAQIFSILSVMLFFPQWLSLVLIWLMCVLTIVSGLQYFYGARSIFKELKGH
ncbi:MAG: CDP-diacylglycerol--glycerol-3-phosphate 3-phosphatidyltransferase [Clostridiales bacterium]|nr:CDP-diacylglycerol--glycerol-3-phosphate 3-phosphatidyltransferase [Clostridiales bacterium]